LRHAASFYRTASDYGAAVDRFVQDCLNRHAAVFLAVPGDHLPARQATARWPGVMVSDMQQLGGNPARIIPALQAFADSHAGQRVCYLSEPVWPGRGRAERREAARHDALLNLAFAGADMSILCLYNVAVLPGSVVNDARGSHPTLMSGGAERVNQDYLGSGELPASLDKPLLAPAHARELSYERDLRPVRALVATVALEAGLSESRRADLVIAASEVAANTLRHTSGGGVIRLWTTEDDVVCQIEDGGHIADPLAGHLRPAADLPGGQGLWLVNQLCDLAEIRTSELGTAIRLRMHRDR
jgi:anti-sigma regulatory factor (Ser/Thr protein kinase)